MGDRPAGSKAAGAVGSRSAVAAGADLSKPVGAFGRAARGGASGAFAVGVARGGASGAFAVRAVRGGASGAIWSGLLAVERR